MVNQNKNITYNEAQPVTPTARELGEIVLKATLKDTYGPDYQENRGLSVVPTSATAEITPTEIQNAS